MTRQPKSTRERVADLKASGAKVREIALALGISTQAVYKHLEKIREDAGVPRKPS